MINQVKDRIYNFFKGEMSAKFPDVFTSDKTGFCEKIYWSKTRDEQPQKPYIVLDCIRKAKVNKAHETYRRKSDNKLIQRENWMIVVTFGVYTQGTVSNFTEADRQAIDYIEEIELLFNSQETFERLYNNGIIVREKEISDIRDLSSFSDTNYSYRYEIDVIFEFDKIIEPKDYGIGERVKTDIEIKDSNLRIQQEIIGDLK